MFLPLGDWMAWQPRPARTSWASDGAASPVKGKGAVCQAESQCAGDGGGEKERGQRGKEKGKCVDKSRGEGQRCYIDGWQMAGAVKAARDGAKPKRGEGEGAKPEGAGGWWRRAGGRGRQEGGAMGAVSSAPLTVSTNTRESKYLKQKL